MVGETLETKDNNGLERQSQVSKGEACDSQKKVGSPEDTVIELDNTERFGFDLAANHKKDQLSQSNENSASFLNLSTSFDKLKIRPSSLLETIPECDEENEDKDEDVENCKWDLCQVNVSEELQSAKSCIILDDEIKLRRMLTIYDKFLGIASDVNKGISESEKKWLFHYACEADAIKCAKLISQDINNWGPSEINFKDARGWTALHYAAFSGSIHCMYFLLQCQMNVDEPSNVGKTPVELAIERYCSSLEAKLKNKWSNEMTTEDFLKHFQQEDLAGVSLLAKKSQRLVKLAFDYASGRNLTALVVLLFIDGQNLVNCCNVNSSDKYISLTESLVNSAILSCDESLIKDKAEPSLPWSGRELILKELEIVLLWKPNLEGKTWLGNAYAPPLVKAAEANDEDVLSLLIEADVPINALDSDGNTALHACLRSRNTKINPSKIVWKLVKNNAKVSVGNKFGATPLHFAASLGRLDSAKILLICDPLLVHSVNLLKETPLHWAVKNNQIECARLLMSYGSNAALPDLRKQRPLDLAMTSEMRQVLLEQHFSGRSDETTCPSLNESDQMELQRLAIANKAYSPSKPLGFNWSTVFPKTEICRYYSMAGGCIRGNACLFAHGENELRTKLPLQEFRRIKTETHASESKVMEDHYKKIFVGGLSPSVDSDDLREYFSRFGPVEEATVIASQTANRMQSRGFGFVSFKHEESAMAAIRDRFVFILGKKVEVKGAIPRIGMQIEVLRSEAANREGFNEIQSFKNAFPSLPGSFQQQQQQQEQQEQEHQQSQEYPQQQQELVKISQARTGEPSYAQEIAAEKRTTFSTAIVQQIGENVQLTKTAMDSKPYWLIKLREWMPGFLQGVAARLAEGEWYPLSSLKGDFRATCGLELDHASLGFLKLSDFIRSLSDVCRMKIVPVGKGPATHMVLLPPVKQNSNRMVTATSKSSQPTSSIVVGNRSYAAAILGQNTVTIEKSESTLVHGEDAYKQGLSPTNNENGLSKSGNELIESNTCATPSHNINGKRKLGGDFVPPDLEELKISLLDSFNLVQSAESSLESSPMGKITNVSDKEATESNSSEDELLNLISMLQIPAEKTKKGLEGENRKAVETENFILKASADSKPFPKAPGAEKWSMTPFPVPITPPKEDKRPTFVFSPKASISPNPPIDGHSPGSAITPPTHALDEPFSSPNTAQQPWGILGFPRPFHQGVLERMATEFYFPSNPHGLQQHPVPVPPVFIPSTSTITSSYAKQGNKEYPKHAKPPYDYTMVTSHPTKFAPGIIGSEIQARRGGYPFTARPSWPEQHLQMDAQYSQYPAEWQAFQMQNRPHMVNPLDHPQQQQQPQFQSHLQHQVHYDMPHYSFNPPVSPPQQINNIPNTSLICVVCNQRRSHWVNLPCGHEMVCTMCKEAIQMQNGAVSCPLCKSNRDQLPPRQFD